MAKLMCISSVSVLVQMYTTINCSALIAEDGAVLSVLDGNLQDNNFPGFVLPHIKHHLVGKSSTDKSLYYGLKTRASFHKCLEHQISLFVKLCCGSLQEFCISGLMKFCISELMKKLKSADYRTSVGLRFRALLEQCLS